MNIKEGMGKKMKKDNFVRKYSGRLIIMKKAFLLVVILINVVVCLQAQTTDSLIVSENGNVGIGTETPQVKLEVNGDIKGVNVEAEALTASQINGSITSSQLDYIYAGNQAIVDYWTGTLTTTPVELARGYTNSLIGTPLIPNPDSDNYTLCYYFSAAGGTSGDPVDACIDVNGRNVLSYTYNGGTIYRRAVRSNFFTSWTEFTATNVGPYGNGLQVTMRSTAGTIVGYLWNLTVHYVYIRNGVDYPKLFP